MSHNFEADGPNAIFARLNENNMIDLLFVIERQNMQDSEGVENEALGIAICKEEFGGDAWIRVSRQPEHLGGIFGYWFTYDAENQTLTMPEEPTVEEPANDQSQN
jgi:hypothetical protein